MTTMESVRETTAKERAEALTIGAEALALIVAEEARNLSALRAMLRLTHAVMEADAPNDVFRNADRVWERGLDVLERFYDDVGVTQEMINLGSNAREAQALGIVSGHLVFLSGDATALPRAWADAIVDTENAANYRLGPQDERNAEAPC